MCETCKVSVVIPVYNEVENITEISKQINQVFNDEGIDGEIIFSNDGSSNPMTSKEINEVILKNKNIRTVELTKNYGQHKAILAGYEIAIGKYIITMDSDLEQSPKDIVKLLKEIESNDYDVVFANFVRKHGKIKNFFSKFYGKLENYLLDFPENIYRSPFFIIKRSIKNKLIQISSPSPNISVLISMITKKIGKIVCEQNKRVHGETKYTIFKMFDLASCLFFDKARVFQTFFYILFGITFTIPVILFFVGSQNYINSIFLILFSFVFLGIALNLEYLHRINKNLIGDSRGKKRDE
tara:strand:+ start:1033 stop:1923 length:891 start_codon:yes stop_codon:yes gene_type:complete